MKKPQQGKRFKNRKYDILHLNCDCCSTRIAVKAGKTFPMGPRCPGCDEVLGPMQWRILGSVVSKYGELGALERFENPGGPTMSDGNKQLYGGAV